MKTRFSVMKNSRHAVFSADANGRMGLSLAMTATVCALLYMAVVCLAPVQPLYAQEGSFDWSEAHELYPGIRHVSLTVDTPRPMHINCLQIDTHAPGLRFYATPRCDPWEANVAETVRLTTRQFIMQARAAGRPVVAAINADAWAPWIPATWNQQITANVSGLAVSDGVLVSPGSGRPSLIIRKDGTAEMALTDADTDISDIHTAVSGFGFVLMDGEILPAHVDLHPRTGTGVCQDGRMVYFLTVDGRQQASRGASYQELGAWLVHFGAHTGINMDGGGSTTMAWWDPQQEGPDKTVLLNVPVGDGRTPGGERCNGNNIGVYYEVQP